MQRQQIILLLPVLRYLRPVPHLLYLIRHHLIKLLYSILPHRPQVLTLINELAHAYLFSEYGGVHLGNVLLDAVVVAKDLRKVVILPLLIQLMQILRPQPQSLRDLIPEVPPRHKIHILYHFIAYFLEPLLG